MRMYSELFRGYLMLSISLYIFAPSPHCLHHCAFSSQRGKNHLHREGLTSQVITKPSVRLINSVAIKNASRAKTSVSKEGT